MIIEPMETLVFERKFLLAIVVSLKTLIKEFTICPFFSIMVDEFTDRVLQLQLIICVIYLENDGIGHFKTKFLMISNIHFLSIEETRIEYDLVQSHLIGFDTDGDASMVGMYEGPTTKLKKKVLHLFRTHCIVHTEALASKDAVKAIILIALLEKLFNRLHGWIGKFFLKNQALQGLLTLQRWDN